jgi:beta-glucosidase/6-phospho-beta-glucosidase/beta-galactosidase/ABC-type amino acid transport substrate-binding protein
MSLRNSLSSLLGKSDLPSLPESFFFGVATADHQCEAYDQNYIDIRDIWEQKVHPEASRRRATDFWNRYEEDVDLARGLGCKAFRFSIAWSRVEPAPGQFNEAAFDHYQALIDKIISCQMTPILTLHHFTWPVHVERRGGMTSDDFPAMFSGYVKETARRFAKDVPYWLTFNEPNLMIGGYFKPWWDANYSAPPGMPEGTTEMEQVEALGKLIRNLFLSHKAAYEIIKGENPNAMIGANQYFYGLPGWIQQLVDGNARRIKGTEDLLGQRNRLAQRPSLLPGSQIQKAWANILMHGKADVTIAALTQTPERELQVMFSETYFVARQQLLVRDERNVTRAEELSGRAIAVAKGSVSERELSNLVAGAEANAVDDYDAALQALDSGNAEALMSDSTILHGLMARHPGKFRLLGERLGREERYAAAVARGNGDLLHIVDAAVRDFRKSRKSTEWKVDYEEQTGQRILEPAKTMRAIILSESSVSADERLTKELAGPAQKAPLGTALRRIQDRGYISVAVRQDLPGFAFPDPKTGELSGLEIDLARAVAFKIFSDESKVKFLPVETTERITRLRPNLGFIDYLLEQYSILTTLLMSNWWYQGMAGNLDEFLCPAGCAGKLDFVGLDYYWGISNIHIERILRLVEAAYRHFDRAPVWPGALDGILQNLQTMFRNMPIIIFENGSVDVADGIDRATYLCDHVKQIQKAVSSKINVQGYICWSITSNREWDCVFDKSSDFGLFHIELDDDPALRRHKTASADVYSQIIQNRGD